jgi:hypothetical protein
MKFRVLIVSSVVPAENRGGGCLALYRHFCLRDDFEVAVASQYASYACCGDRFEIRTNRFWGRAKRTQFRRWLENVDYLMAGFRLPKPLLQFARLWRPDIIFSVADDTHAPMGFRLAKRLRIPFAVHFQDLFACSTFLSAPIQPFGFLRPLLLMRYRRLQDKADVVFHICSGMRAWFGNSARGDILYSLAGKRDGHEAKRINPVRGHIRLVYAGNCYGPYGLMMLRLARLLERHPTISLEVFTMGNDWPSKDIQHFSKVGIYRGFLSFKELKFELERADAFLLTMGFGELDRTFMETSFPTKWVDYTPYGKPIFVWAPEYSSSARFARDTGAGIIVDKLEPQALVTAIETTAADASGWLEAGLAAARVAATEFNAKRLHGLLREKLLAVIAMNRLRRHSH